MNHDTSINTNQGFAYIERAYIPNTSHIIVIVEAIKRIMEKHFAATARNFTLVNDLTFDDPETTRDYKEIRICCVYTYWTQIAYQFSHEFCHLMIGKAVASNLCWFEESIAETSSWFFIMQLSAEWKSTGILGDPDYADSLVNYINARTSRIISNFSMCQIWDDTSELSEYLKHNCYDRDKNAHVARFLFSVFLEYPILWEIVPKLSDIPNDLTFSKSCEYWKTISGAKYNSALDKLIGIFKPTNNSN